MKTFITSDTHWGHRNIMKFCSESRARFGNDLDYMNEQMIVEWNNLISPGDLVYILGDVAFLPAAKAVECMTRCNGTKILVAGNHDTKLLKDDAFRNVFKEVHNYLELTFNCAKLVMFHYPILDHNGAGHGSIMLHGHRHGTPHNIPGRIMDVGMDATGVIAVNLADVVAAMQQVPHMYHKS